MEYYFTFKALHVVFMVTWFAGLFYIVRLYVYHREAQDKTEIEKNVLIPQFQLMEKRLWYAITWPSAIICTVFALIMLGLNTALLSMPYMQVKLGFVAGLLGYQIYLHFLFRKFQANKNLPSSIALRFINEVPTVILIAVVFLIIQKTALGWVSGLVGILGVAIVLTIAIKRYQKFRKTR